MQPRLWHSDIVTLGEPNAHTNHRQVTGHYSGDAYGNAVTNGTGYWTAGAISSSGAGYCVTYLPAGLAPYQNADTQAGPGSEVAHVFGAKVRPSVHRRNRTRATMMAACHPPPRFFVAR